MRAAYEPLATRPTKAGVKKSRKIAECLPFSEAIKRIETVILLDFEGTQCPSMLFGFQAHSCGYVYDLGFKDLDLPTDTDLGLKVKLLHSHKL